MSLQSVHMKHLRSLLQVGSDEQLAKKLEKIHPTELIYLFSELSEEQIKRLVNSLFLVEKAGLTLKELPEFLLPDILEIIDSEKLSVIINRLNIDDASYLLTKISEKRLPLILEPINQNQRIQLEKLLLYPKGSAGAIMNPVCFSVEANLTAQQAIESLHNFPTIESILYVYVVDQKRLVGVLTLRNLVVAKPDELISNIMKKKVISVSALSSQDETAQIVSQYDLLAIPVVDDNNNLTGVISVDDIIDVFENEATEDIYHIAGLSGSDRSYTPIKEKVKKRLPWLFVNLATAFLASMVIASFQNTIHQLTILAAYMPIIAGLGGNGGTQSMVVITRSIALGELEFAKSYQAVLKEVGNNTILGIIAGSIIAIAAYFLNANPRLGGILFLSMVLNMFLAGVMGACVPLTLKKLGRDPAVGASIFVTASTDIMGFLIFLGLATLLL